MTELARMALEASMPKGYIPTPNSLIFTQQTKPVTGEDRLTQWQMKVEQRIYKSYDEFQVVNLIQGRTLVRAAEQLNSFLDLKSPPLIKLMPPWWPWLPINPFRITVVVQ